MVRQGSIHWVDFGTPIGSEPGYVRPVVVVQSDQLNRSRIATVVCVPLSSQLKWANAPGNVLLPAKTTGLARDSVAVVSQVVALDRARFAEIVGEIPQRAFERIIDGISLVIGR